MRRTRFLAPALALFLGACGRGCCVGEHTTETFHGKTKVTVREVKSFSNASFITSWVLDVERPQFSVGIRCAKPALAEDDTGNFIGWRCPEDKAWQLVRIVGAHHFNECDVPELGSDPEKASFATVKRIEDAAVHIVECREKELYPEDDPQMFHDLADDIRNVHGPAGVGAFMAQTATWGETNPNSENVWPSVARDLAPPDRVELEKALCPQLEKPMLPAAYVHAARICPSFSTAAGDNAIRRLSGGADLASPWAALIAASSKPPGAGTAACSGLATGDPKLRAEWSAIVAATKTKCPSPIAFDCAELDLCGAKVCSPSQASDAVDTWLHEADAPKAIRAQVLDLSRLVTAAAWVQGPIDKDLVLRRERTSYPIASGSGPLCFDAPIAKGAPCSCGEMPPALAICGAGAKDKTFTFKTCTFPIDDARRTLGPPVRNCMDKAGDDCVDVKCCPGLTCTLDPASMRSSCK